MTDLPGSGPETSDPPPTGAGSTGEEPPSTGLFGTDVTDPFDPLAPSDHLRRRQFVSRLFTAGQTTAAALAVAVLGVVVYSVAARAASVLSIGFLTSGPPTTLNAPGGGVAPEIVGTIVIVALGAVIATPMGILIGLYLTEFAGRRSGPPIRLALDLLNGMPSILIGLFVFGLLVVGHHQSGFAASVALAIIMLPLIARGTQEVLLLVPVSLREAAQALGVSRWRTVLGVVLPAARSGILTSTVLAVARAAGETAPLIFLSTIYNPNIVSLNPFSHEGLPNIPFYIFTASEADEASGFARAWGAAFVLLAAILLANIAARALNRRSSLSR